MTKENISASVKARLGLSDAFATDDPKQKQWKAFLIRSGLTEAGELEEVVGRLAAFLRPVVERAARDEPYRSAWKPEAGWSE